MCFYMLYITNIREWKRLSWPLNIILFSSSPRNVFKYSKSKWCGQYKSKQIHMKLGYNID